MFLSPIPKIWRIGMGRIATISMQWWKIKILLR